MSESVDLLFLNEIFYMHILQWEKVGILSWLMGKWVENIMIFLQVGSEKLKTKMEGFGCFTGHFKAFFEDILCVFVCKLQYN